MLSSLCFPILNKYFHYNRLCFLRFLYLYALVKLWKIMDIKAMINSMTLNPCLWPGLGGYTMHSRADRDCRVWLQFILVVMVTVSWQKISRGMKSSITGSWLSVHGDDSVWSLVRYVPTNGTLFKSTMSSLLSRQGLEPYECAHRKVLKQSFVRKESCYWIRGTYCHIDDDMKQDNVVMSYTEKHIKRLKGRWEREDGTYVTYLPFFFK